jgi:hypothetical protein
MKNYILTIVFVAFTQMVFGQTGSSYQQQIEFGKGELKRAFEERHVSLFSVETVVIKGIDRGAFEQ